MSYKRGDMVLVVYPDSTLKTYKQRPALIVQADGLATGLPQHIVAMITSNLVRTGDTRVPYCSPALKEQAWVWLQIL
jgi:mRNA interferase MazF